MEELKEFTAPSGDVYKFRLLTYGEKMDLAENKATGSKVRVSPGSKSKEQEMEIDLVSLIKMQRDVVWRTLVSASWLKEGTKSTKELSDKNIKGTDAEAINSFVEALNYPRSDVVEKSNGQ